MATKLSRYLDSARFNLQKLNIQLAIENSHEALIIAKNKNKRKKEADVYNLLGRCYTNKKELSTAKQNYEKALEIAKEKRYKSANAIHISG